MYVQSWVVVYVISVLVELSTGKFIQSMLGDFGSNSLPDLSTINGSVSVEEGAWEPEGLDMKAPTTAWRTYVYNWKWGSDNWDELEEFLGRITAVQSELQNVVIDKTDERDSYNSQRENATFLVLCRNEDLYQLLGSIGSVQDRFNWRYNYDFTFLNDKKFSQEFMSTIAQFIPRGKINFGEIPQDHWSYPDYINQTYAAERREEYAKTGVMYGSSESYRFMCRYFSGFFYKHPLVSQYEYYWRLEPDVSFLCDIDYDLFKFMNINDKKYGFVMSMFEYEATVPTLWVHFKEFVASNRNESLGRLIDFVQNNDEYESYNLCHFWTNFEIASLSLYDEHYENLFQYLDKAGGFFYERWGDAPVHTLAVAWLLGKEDVWWFDNVGYYHPPYLQCPRDKYTRLKNRCSCDPADDFTFSFISCIPHFLLSPSS